MARLSDLGELEALERVSSLVIKHLASRRAEVFGVGDDAQAIRLGDLWLFLKIDGTTASSSMYPWLTFGDLGYRVALSATTDLIAKNSAPLLVVSSVTLSGSTPLEVLEDVVSGIASLAEAVGALYVGGDLNRLDYADVVIDVASVGVSKSPIPSHLLRENLVVYSTRCLGLSAIPAALFYLKKDASAWTDILLRLARPEPPLGFLKLSERAVAATDVSDGLTSLRKALRGGGVDLVMTLDAICPEVLEFSAEERLSPDLVLSFMGEEYSVVFASEENLPAHKVGVTKRGRGGVYLEGKELRGGWDNFLGYLTVSEEGYRGF